MPESASPDTALVEANATVVTRGIARVSPGIFNLLGGVRPVRGRLFDPSEGRPGADDRVLLSEDLWRTLYRGDPSIVGRRVTMKSIALQISVFHLGNRKSEGKMPTTSSASLLMHVAAGARRHYDDHASSHRGAPREAPRA